MICARLVLGLFSRFPNLGACWGSDEATQEARNHPPRPSLGPLPAAVSHLKVAFVTPELQSLVRRTNLAEIAEYLPRSLVEAGAQVVVCIPHHAEIELDSLTRVETVGSVEVLDDESTVSVGIVRGLLDDLPIILFEHEDLFTGRHPYGEESGPYADNWRRYSVFCRAVLASFKLLGFIPDVIHGFDWTAGLIPVLHQLAVEEDKEHELARAGTFFAIHNMAMQGSYERSILPKIGLPHSLFQAIEGVELGGKVNFLKAGSEFSTIIGASTPAVAEQFISHDRGDGLDETFRRRPKEIVGVLGGVNYGAWDPLNDPLLPASFSAGSPNGKKRCKAQLQATLKLDNGPRTPIIGVIGRFDRDSGFDILAEALTPILERNVELVMMGPGQVNIIERMQTVEQTFSGRCRVIDSYDLRTAHVLLAGADILLLPAHYQPSNFLPAIAMRYGVVPIAYAGAGLVDSIVDMGADPTKGTGYFFSQYTTDSMLESIDDARTLYKKAGEWSELLERCLAADFSWNQSASNYLKAYRRVTRRVRGR